MQKEIHLIFKKADFLLKVIYFFHWIKLTTNIGIGHLENDLSDNYHLHKPCVTTYFKTKLMMRTNKVLTWELPAIYAFSKVPCEAANYICY